MPYDPKPIDNSHIVLSTPLNQLIERLAANNHDLWARRRIGEGWRHGPRRDDLAKESPTLIPYDELPESEKEYDRENAVETIKTIMTLGWTIQDPNQPPNKAWNREEFQARAEESNAEGESLRACDIANDGLLVWPGDLKLLQMKALALARMGSRESAHRILSQLQSEGHTDVETLGLVARTYKDLWLRSGNAQDLEEARKAYLRAFNNSESSYWMGINAATLTFVKGEAQAARDLAARVRPHCEEELRQKESYWANATLAEVYLLLDSIPEAEEYYGRAARFASEQAGHVLSTWRNARLILPFLPSAVSERIERALQVPKVAVFTGHRADEPGSRVRFPAERTGRVKEQIRDHLLRTNARHGYSSAASGADILFLEAMQALGGKTYVVLPCNEDQFVQESVAGWVRNGSNASVR